MRRGPRLQRSSGKNVMMAMKKKSLPLTEQLRQAVVNCGQTRYAISKATGVGADTLCRFVNGERFLSAEAIDALGEYLGLEIRKRRATKEKDG